MIFPKRCRGSRLNGDSSLLLLLHEVGSRGSVMDLTDLMDLAGNVQNPLGCCGFTRIYVRKNTNISIKA
jgi:hypothetical protein